MTDYMNAESLIVRIRSDYFTARKERNLIKSQILLLLVSAIDNASAVDVPTGNDVTEAARRILSVDDLREIIKNEISEMQEASAMYKDVDAKKREDLEIKMSILKRYYLASK